MSVLELRIPTASEWKTVAVYLGTNLETPHKVVLMTSEPAPMTTLGVSGRLFMIHDVEEHIDGGFSAFVTRADVFSPTVKN